MPLALIAASMFGSAALAREDGDYEEIVVHGHILRCHSLAGDPLNDVNLRPGNRAPGLMAVIPAGPDRFVLAPNSEQITGPEFWQPVGVGMDAYSFRAPADGKPMCVGGQGSTDGFAGFRRIVDAAPFRGKRLRFTAWVATRRARQVSFWLVAGSPWHEKPGRSEKIRPNQLLNGGNTNNVPFGGDHGWTPVLLETGPVHRDADHISYGFNLLGAGDVWVYAPKLEIVTDQPDATGDLIEIGRAQQ